MNHKWYNHIKPYKTYIRIIHSPVIPPFSNDLPAAPGPFSPTPPWPENFYGKMWGKCHGNAMEIVGNQWENAMKFWEILGNSWSKWRQRVGWVPDHRRNGWWSSATFDDTRGYPSGFCHVSGCPVSVTLCLFLVWEPTAPWPQLPHLTHEFECLWFFWLWLWIIVFYALCRMNHVCTFARFQGCSPATPGNFEGVKSVKIVRWHYPSVPLQMWLQMYLSDGWSNPDLVWYHILSYACFHPLTIPWNPMNSNEIPLPGQRLALAVAPQPKPAEYRGIHLGEASDPGKE